MKDITIATKMLQIAKSAKDRNLEFNLTFYDVKRLLNSKRCYFTRKPFVNITNDDNKLTIDRLDNTKGYITGNVVACSLLFNRKKGSLNTTDIRQMYNGLKKRKLI